MSAVVVVQYAQVEWPVAAVEYVPCAHWLQDATEGAPGVGENVLSGQGVHVALEDAPMALENDPLGQGRQDDEPGAD